MSACVACQQLQLTNYPFFTLARTHITAMSGCVCGCVRVCACANKLNTRRINVNNDLWLYACSPDQLQHTDLTDIRAKIPKMLSLPFLACLFAFCVCVSVFVLAVFL